MRKTIIEWTDVHPDSRTEQEWFNLEEVAKVEVTSEDANFPIESALVSGQTTGWRAVQPGEQTIRIVFDNAVPLCQIEIEFTETEKERTQEFLLQWSVDPDGPLKDIVRQQWSFSPQGPTKEIENYRVNLKDVSVLQLSIKPDLNPLNAYATLTRWRVK